MTAERAHELGLLDDVVGEDRDLIECAVHVAHRLATAATPPEKTRDRDDRLAPAREQPELFDDYRAKIARRARGLEAPFACIDCIEAAVNRSFAEGIALERETFQRCRSSEQSKALRHAFFAERQARKVLLRPSNSTC